MAILRCFNTSQRARASVAGSTGADCFYGGRVGLMTNNAARWRMLCSRGANRRQIWHVYSASVRRRSLGWWPEGQAQQMWARLSGHRGRGSTLQQGIERQLHTQLCGNGLEHRFAVSGSPENADKTDTARRRGLPPKTGAVTVSKTHLSPPELEPTQPPARPGVSEHDVRLLKAIRLNPISYSVEYTPATGRVPIVRAERLRSRPAPVFGPVDLGALRLGR